MKVVIDRFEGDYAICETESEIMLGIEKSKLPENMHEGDVLIVTEGSVVYDKQETIKRKQAIEELTKDLWK